MLLPAAIGLAASIGGSYFGNRGRRREIERRQRAVAGHRRTTNELALDRAGLALGQGQRRLQGLGQVADAYRNPNVAGAQGEAQAMADRVAARLGPQAQPGAGESPWLREMQSFLATARQPAQDQAAAWQSGQAFQALQRQPQQARAGAALHQAAMAPEDARLAFVNAWLQQQADNELQEALGGYSDSAAGDELMGAILQGLGGLGMNASAYMGHGG